MQAVHDGRPHLGTTADIEGMPMAPRDRPPPPRKKPRHPDDLRYGFEYAITYAPRPQEDRNPQQHDKVEEFTGHFLRLTVSGNMLHVVLDLGDEHHWIPWPHILYIERIDARKD